MMRRTLAIICLGIAAACSTSEPLPDAEYVDPVLRADGSLSGVTGIDGRHWSLVDEHLRRGIFWHRFVDRLTAHCPTTFPEHADWLAEVGRLSQRASGVAMRNAIEMERLRLQQIAPGADRAATGLAAMSEAEFDVAGLVRSWIRTATGADVTNDQGWIQGCSLLFDKESLRGLFQNATRPLATYYARMQDEHPEIYAGVPGVEGIARRLNKV